MGIVCEGFVGSSLPKETDKTNVFRFSADVIPALHFLLTFECYCALVIEVVHTPSQILQCFYCAGEILSDYQKITR